MAEFAALQARAAAAVRANIVTTSHGALITAGGHQFRTLWTRDFALSVPGLLALGEATLVRRQLALLFEFQREDGLLPRGLDVTPPQWRVVRQLLRPGRPANDEDYLHRKLRAEYLGEHRTIAIDSNVLTVRALLQYLEHTGDELLWRDLSPKIARALALYLPDSRGFYSQPPFSDWQDSVRRSGPGLYLHVLLADVHRRLQGRAAKLSPQINLKTWGAAFFNAQRGMFAQSPGGKQIPLEANLWIAEFNLFPEIIGREELIKQLLNSPLNQIAGVPVDPPSPRLEVSWTTHLVGLSGYHDRKRWSWLIAELSRVSRLCGEHNSATEFLTLLGRWAERDETICEIYDLDGTPTRSLFYASERPFTWGAAKIIEALHAREA